MEFALFYNLNLKIYNASITFFIYKNFNETSIVRYANDLCVLIESLLPNQVRIFSKVSIFIRCEFVRIATDHSILNGSNHRVFTLMWLYFTEHFLPIIAIVRKLLSQRAVIQTLNHNAVSALWANHNPAK